jgi:hypothetical protein
VAESFRELHKINSQDEPSLPAQGLAWQSHPQAALHITLLQDMAFGLQHIQQQREWTNTPCNSTLPSRAES